jgi:hypothetical protein
MVKLSKKERHAILARCTDLEETSERRSLTYDEVSSMTAMSAKLSADIEARTPRATCCKEMLVFPSATFVVEEGVGYWLAAHAPEKGHYASAARAVAKFCSYCCAPMPKVRRMKDPPPVAIVNDGGYYCTVCNERVQRCSCLPPECAWEIDI